MGMTVTELVEGGFADIVCTARKKKGWTLKKLSLETKISIPTISGIEHGRNMPSVKNLFVLAVALDIRLDPWIFRAKPLTEE